MTQPVRRGGRGRLPDGALLTWSVAEGGRGRRWRATLVHGERLVCSLLLETNLDGRPARLEVDATAGLLTLHPTEDERELHGNVVRPDGVYHLAFGWSSAHELVVTDVPLVAMAALARLGRDVGIGEGRELAAVVIGPDLDLGPASWRVERVGVGLWRTSGPGGVGEIAVDEAGLPAGLDDAETWALEA